VSRSEDSISAGVNGLLAPGETVVSALVVSPRGSTTASVGGMGPGEIGARWAGKNRAAAAEVGLVVKRSSGLALTTQRLLTLDLAISMTGSVKEVKGLLSEIPLDRVDQIRSKWNVLTISAGGTEFKLECKPPAAKALAKAFGAARDAA
jgi:hypothetical protein